MRKYRRTTRLRTCALAAAACAAGTLAFTGSALANTYNVTTEAGFETAIASSNTAGGANTINLAAGQYNPTATLALTSGTLTIQGTATPDATTAASAAQITGGSLTNPQPGASVFTVAPGVTVNFNNIQMASSGSAGNGTIDDSGTVHINQSMINPTGPALTVQGGGTATVTNSTISDGLDFGIIDNGTATLTNTTVTRNSNGGVDNAGGTLSLVNSVVAQNGTPDCTAAANTNDHSFDSNSASVGGANTCGLALSGDAMLGSLGLHGGTTATDIPKAASPLIHAGDPAAGKCPAVDQRNAPSPSVAGNACDIGAVATYYGVAPVVTTAPVHVSSPSAAGTVANYLITWRAGSPVTAGSCSPASGTVFAPGNTTVTCTGTDSLFGATGNSTFVVTDSQSTPPVVTTSGNQTVAATGASGATATFTATATDSTDGTDPVTCKAPLGAGSPPAAVTVTSGTTVFPIGVTTVTCSATDSASLTGTATFTVTINDPAPVVTPSANLTGSGASGSTVTFNPIPSATDFADGTDPVTCTAPIGAGSPPATVTVTSGTTVFPVGTTTVTCSATNHATPPATGTATFTVTVNSVTPSFATDTVKGEVPNGGQAGGLQITAATCDFGPVFIPALSADATYTCTAAVSVTSTDSTTTLSINDVNTTAGQIGHLVNPVGPAVLQTAATDKATSANSGPGSPTAYQTLTGSAAPILTYNKPVNSDPVTLNFQQLIKHTEPLTNGTYGATVLLALSGTP